MSTRPPAGDATGCTLCAWAQVARPEFWTIHAVCPKGIKKTPAKRCDHRVNEWRENPYAAEGSSAARERLRVAVCNLEVTESAEQDDHAQSHAIKDH